MRRFSTNHFLLVGSLSLVVGASSVDSQENTSAASLAFIPGEYLIRLAPGFSIETQLDELARRLKTQVQLVEDLHTQRLFRIRISLDVSPNLPMLASKHHGYAIALNETEAIQHVEPILRLRLADALVCDSDFDRSLSDLFKRLGTPDRRSITPLHPGPPVVVAVIDSGFQIGHEIFSNILMPGFDATNGVLSAGAKHLPNGKIESHATGVAGLIAWILKEGKIDGQPAFNVTILPIRATQADQRILSSDAIKAIEFAIKRGAKLINVSWGDVANSEELKGAIARANEADILIVAAAGNGRSEGSSLPPRGYNIDALPYFYPASFQLPNIVSVAALDQNDELAKFSNWGSRSVELAAPGQSIVVPTPLFDSGSGRFRSGYQCQSGTSFSAPLVSAAIAAFVSGSTSIDIRSVPNLLSRRVSKLKTLDGLVSSGGRLDIQSLLSASGPLPYDATFLSFKDANRDFRFRLVEGNIVTKSLIDVRALPYQTEVVLSAPSPIIPGKEFRKDALNKDAGKSGNEVNLPP